MRLGVDAMGGDFAPAEPVRGALAARDILGKGDQVVLIGDREAIEPLLAEAPDWRSFITVNHAPEVVGMDEAPVEALRQKPNSSIARMAELARDGEVDAIISAGNTGACVAACQMRLRRLPGVVRPGIAVIVPTFYGPVTICDVGANVNCRPRHLYQYGIMAGEYARGICGVSDPRVGLLSVGREEGKGNQLVKETRELLRADPAIQFVGNVEGRDLFGRVCDVVVSEGFVGNVVLKLIEGMVEGVFLSLKQELSAAGPDVPEAFRAVLGGIRHKFDFNEYGGAPLLGVNGVCIICHGASAHRAITNAIRVAIHYAKTGVNERIVKRLAQCQDQGDA